MHFSSAQKHGTLCMEFSGTFPPGILPLYSERRAAAPLLFPRKPCNDPRECWRSAGSERPGYPGTSLAQRSGVFFYSQKEAEGCLNKKRIDAEDAGPPPAFPTKGFSVCSRHAHTERRLIRLEKSERSKTINGWSVLLEDESTGYKRVLMPVRYLWEHLKA